MMADYQPVQESDLETGPEPSAGIVGNGAGDLSKYQPANENDLIPDTGAPQRGFRGLPYSQGAINRLNQGERLSPIIDKVANNFGDSYNAMTADEFQKINDFLPQGPSWDVGGGALRFFGRALMADAARIKAATLSLFPAVVGGVAQAAGEASKALGGPDITEDTEHNLNIAATDAGINMMLLGRTQYAEATRVVPNPGGGGLMDQRIGPVPTNTEAAAQAATIATHYGIPDAAPAITAAYEKGVLPAEIFHDAKTVATILPDLVEGKVPEAYPVSDWTGGHGATQAARAEATEAEAPAATEITPPPPTPAGRLPAGAPRPVVGTGELKPLSLAESTEAAAINAGLAEDFGELPTYQVVKDTDQGAMALKFLKNDPEAAMEVAMGTRAAPKGMLPEAAYVAVKNKAVAEGDVELIRTLATQSNLTQQAKTMGQRISYLRNVNPENDPVAAIQQVQEARQAALKAKGIDTAANENQAAAEYAPIRAATRSAKGPDAWNNFLKSITCAE